jgi:hypothetical protein
MIQIAWFYLKWLGRNAKLNFVRNHCSIRREFSTLSQNVKLKTEMRLVRNRYRTVFFVCLDIRLSGIHQNAWNRMSYKLIPK